MRTAVTHIEGKSGAGHQPTKLDLQSACNQSVIMGRKMRLKKQVRTERAQLAISDNASRILLEIADLGIRGKTKAEIASRKANK